MNKDRVNEKKRTEEITQIILVREDTRRKSCQDVVIEIKCETE